MPKILITGATGFSGRAFVKDVILQKQFSLIVIVRKRSDITKLKKLSPAIKVYLLDSSYEKIYQILRVEKPDVVLHLSGLFLVDQAREKILPLIESNILFPTKLLEAMRLANVKRIINIGTFWEHYESHRLYNPVNLYAATKKAFEDILIYYEQAHQFHSITLKLFDTYGPEDNRGKFFSFLQKAATATKKIPFSPGNQSLDFLYIDDVVSAYKKAIAYILKKETNTHEIFFIGSGRSISLQKITRLYEKIIQKKLQIFFGAKSYRSRQIMKAKAPISQAEKILGWRAKISLEEGIKKMLQIDSYD